MAVKFDVLNRWTGKCQFEAEIDCGEDTPPRLKLGLAVKWAFRRGADLSGAVLSGADLRDADLSGAVLSGADLRDADLRGAVLSGAVLSGADLRDAVLSGADLSGAVLSGADLSGADLRGADLRGADLRDAVLSGAVLRDAVLSGADLSGAVLSGADLSGAVLSGADLRDAVLSGADLRSFKADMWMTLTENPGEVPALIKSLRDGKVDGSQYEGECACLVGTIARAKRVDYHNLTHNPRNPAERWFAMIRQGDKPGDDSAGGFAASKALEWAEEFCRLHGIAVEAA